MTRTKQVVRTCVCCGEISSHIKVLATNRIGSYDLDYRPPPQQRHIIHMLMETCPYCCIVLPHLEKELTGIDKETMQMIVKTNKYQKLFHDERFPPLVRRLLCCCLVYSFGSSGSESKQGHIALHAAWVCDDNNKEKASVYCRKQAIRYFIQCRKLRRTYASDSYSEDAILCDLFRRTGSFAWCLQKARKNLELKPPKLLKSVFKFQILLCNKKDTNCYKLTDIKLPKKISRLPEIHTGKRMKF